MTLVCGCGGTKVAGAGPAQARVYSSSGNYTLVLPGGDQMVFGSRLEADAENARLGYTGIVKPIGQG